MVERYPVLYDRVLSTFIDNFFILNVMYAIADKLDNTDGITSWERRAILMGIYFGYEPICMTLGATLGNLMRGIRVRQVTDATKRINLLQAIVRFPIKLFLGWLSIETIKRNPRRQAIHDQVAGTVVIKL